jgi:YVTN family beta-propeller protein
MYKPAINFAVAAFIAFGLTATHSVAATTPKLPEVIGLVPINGSVFTTALNNKLNEIYAINSDNSKLYIIDGKTDKLKGQPFDLGSVVNGIVYNSKTDQIIITGLIDGKLQVIDRKTMQFVGAPVPLGLHPVNVVVDETTNTAFVSVMHSGYVAVVDLKKHIVKTKIKIGTGAPTPAGCDPWDSKKPCTTQGSNPLDMTFHQKTHKLYVAAYLENTVSVINTLTNKVVGSRIPVGSQPNGFGFNETTNRLYVNNWQDGTVSVIDGKTNKVIGKPIVVGSGLQKPAHCYEAGKVTACKSWGSMPLGPIGVNEATNQLYVASSNDGTLITIDGKTNKVAGADVPVTTGFLVPAGCANFGVCKKGSSAQNVIYNKATDKIYVVSLRDGWVMVLKSQGSKATHAH